MCSLARRRPASCRGPRGKEKGGEKKKPHLNVNMVSPARPLPRGAEHCRRVECVVSLCAANPRCCPKAEKSTECIHSQSKRRFVSQRAPAEFRWVLLALPSAMPTCVFMCACACVCQPAPSLCTSCANACTPSPPSSFLNTLPHCAELQVQMSGLQSK